MNPSIINYFDIPIYQNQIDNLDNVQEELSKAVANTEFSQVPNWNSHHLSNTNFDIDWLEEHHCSLLKEQIDINVKQYLQILHVLATRPYKYKSSWCTKTLNKEYAHLHHHGSSDMSGVYYFQTSGDDGNLYFESPMSNYYSWFLPHIQAQHHIAPSIGQLVLFPGWLRHGVRTNTTNSERMSISFNLIFERD